MHWMRTNWVARSIHRSWPSPGVYCWFESPACVGAEAR